MNFDTTFDRVVGIEGGYVNNLNDPGGETNWGISKRSYPDVNIKTLTRDGAKTIYRRDFWDQVNADGLPDGVVYQLFDFAFNSGIRRAIRSLQKAIGVVDDGVWGLQSRTKALGVSGSDMIQLLLAERLDFMTSLPNWPTAGRGWARRIATNLRYGAADS